MNAQITIIGLGKIGASIGLALGKHTDLLTRTGNDIDNSVARQAHKLGAVDKIHVNLPASVENADIILLALPADQIRATLEVIAQDVKENAVVMETSPCKRKVSEWIRELLPNHCHHIGLAPVLNPAYLDEPASGIEAARADLYEKGLVAITGDGEAIKLAADFVALLGAVPLFTDLDELDGFLAAVHTLPKLTAAALTNALIQAPGWTDRRKLAGNMFAASTALAADGGAALYEEALANRENILHVLDNLIAELAVFRYELDEKNVALKSHFESAIHSREHWLKERRSGNWLTAEMRTPEIPRFRDHLKQIVGNPAKLFGLRRKTTKDE